jgi:23S rRNA (adenine-N6)-dimethyltransferase
VGANVSRSRRQPETSPGGFHVISSRLATELVRDFEVRSDELVVEVGSGTGRLTRELARSGATVLAIELEPALAGRLLGSARSWPNVFVHSGDALNVALPDLPFRVVGNIPFGITTALLRRSVETPTARRIDLIVQLGSARKRASARGNVLAVVWGTTWRFDIARRIPARLFHPRPSVDAAWLRGVRRNEPLVSPRESDDFERFVRAAFGRADAPLPFATGMSRRLLTEAGVHKRARVVDLSVQEWIRVFRRAAR